jgi:hypothetical protein
MGYAYLWTPAGLTEKSKLTIHFLRRKLCEYDALREEITQLELEVRPLPLQKRQVGYSA